MKTLYHSEVNFLSNKVRYFITAILFIAALLVIVSYVVDFNASWFHKPSLAVVIIIVILMIVLMAVAMFLTVSLTIDAKEIQIKCISTKRVKLKDIEKVEVIEVDPVKDYGGWGYRTKKGKRAFINGDTNKGVLIAVKDEPSLFISTDDYDRIVRVLKG